MAAIDFGQAMREAVLSVREDLGEVVRRVVREECGRILAAGDPGALLDADQAATLLGMSATALRRACERGTFPVEPQRFGRRLRWRRGDLLAIAADRAARKA